jgi:flagellar biosynthesis protein FlhF
MHIKQFDGPSVREAMEAAKETLGPDALLLSTELVAAPGWRGWLGQRTVRVTGGVDRQPLSESRTNAPDGRHLVRPRRNDRRDRARTGVVARLMAAGLDATLAEATAAQLSDADCRNLTTSLLLQALGTELSGMVASDVEYSRYEVFVGPPGVGTTTTIAKIAAQERAGLGRALGLISTDGFRAGAIEHLRSYAAIIGAPFRAARTPDEFRKVLASTRSQQLVDTAGRAPTDDGFRDMLELLGQHRDVRTHLVLAADTSVSTARRIFDKYALAKPSRVVITKLDETDSMHGVFSVVRERGLPVSFVAAGQQVPDDIERATPAWLAAALLGEGNSGAVACQ